MTLSIAVTEITSRFGWRNEVLATGKSADGAPGERDGMVGIRGGVPWSVDSILAWRCRCATHRLKNRSLMKPIASILV
ncbi:hypothetical protein [Geobacter anodireducens]